MKYIIFGILLFNLVACSKEEEQEVSQCGDGLLLPSEEIMKEWEQKKAKEDARLAGKKQAH